MTDAEFPGDEHASSRSCRWIRTALWCSNLVRFCCSTSGALSLARRLGAVLEPVFRNGSTLTVRLTTKRRLTGFAIFLVGLGLMAGGYALSNWWLHLRAARDPRGTELSSLQWILLIGGLMWGGAAVAGIGMIVAVLATIRLPGSRPCRFCGHDLRETALDTCCPECGKR
jgi:hypothetical protein